MAWKKTRSMTEVAMAARDDLQRSMALMNTRDEFKGKERGLIGVVVLVVGELDGEELLLYMVLRLLRCMYLAKLN